MLFIEVPDMNDSMSEISIDGTIYNLRFTYNEKYDYWNFGIYDEYEEPLIAMTRIVPCFDLLHYYTDTALPDGVFGCLSDSGIVGRDSFKSSDAEFVYIPYTELEELKEG